MLLPVAPHSLSNVAVSNCFKAGPCFYFYRSVSALWILVSPAYGVNHPPQAAWGINQTVPSSRGNMINIFIGFTGGWFSVDKAALVLCHHTDIRVPLTHTARWGSECALCHPAHLLWSSSFTLIHVIDCTCNWLYYAPFIPCWSQKLITTLIGLCI